MLKAASHYQLQTFWRSFPSMLIFVALDPAETGPLRIFEKCHVKDK